MTMSKTIKAHDACTLCNIPFIARGDGEITILTNLGFETMPIWVVSSLGRWMKIDLIKSSDREQLMKLPKMSDEIQKQIKVNKNETETY